MDQQQMCMIESIIKIKNTNLFVKTIIFPSCNMNNISRYAINLKLYI